jgi:hypothetical protein
VFHAGGEVENVVADGDASTLFAVRRGEDAEREILDWKIGVLVGVRYPALQRRVMRGVRCDHRGFLGNERSQKEKRI